MIDHRAASAAVADFRPFSDTLWISVVCPPTVDSTVLQSQGLCVMPETATAIQQMTGKPQHAVSNILHGACGWSNVPTFLQRLISCCIPSLAQILADLKIVSFR